MLIFWPITLFSNAQKIPNNALSSAPIIPNTLLIMRLVQPTTMLTKTDMRHEET